MSDSIKRFVKNIGISVITLESENYSPEHTYIYFDSVSAYTRFSFAFEIVRDCTM